MTKILLFYRKGKIFTDNILELCQTAAQAILIPLAFYDFLPFGLLFALPPVFILHFYKQSAVPSSLHEKDKVGYAGHDTEASPDSALNRVAVGAVILVWAVKQAPAKLRILVMEPRETLRLNSTFATAMATLLWLLWVRDYHTVSDDSP